MAKLSSKKPNKNANKSNSAPGMSQIVEEEEKKSTASADEEINSGFANYMRSGEGIPPLAPLGNANYLEIDFFCSSQFRSFQFRSKGWK